MVISQRVPRCEPASTAFLIPLQQRLEVALRALRTVARRLGKGSDVDRWSNLEMLSADWDSRTRLLAELIRPGASVLEFGAGRRALGRFLSQGCTYTPSDLVDRGAGTLVCDLNAAMLPAFPPHDVAVFSGVLEYVNDVPRLVRRLSSCVNTIVLSYAAIDEHPSIVYRRADGWVNDFSASDLDALFSESGFTCDHVSRWRDQRIFRFVHR